MKCHRNFGDGVDLLGDGVDLLVDGVDLLGEGVDLLGDGVAQKGDQRLEIRKCDGRTDQQTNQLTWVGARDTCVSKKIGKLICVYHWYVVSVPLRVL